MKKSLLNALITSAFLAAAPAVHSQEADCLFFQTQKQERLTLEEYANKIYADISQQLLGREVETIPYAMPFEQNSKFNYFNGVYFRTPNFLVDFSQVLAWDEIVPITPHIHIFFPVGELDIEGRYQQDKKLTISAVELMSHEKCQISGHIHSSKLDLIRYPVSLPLQEPIPQHRFNVFRPTPSQEVGELANLIYSLGIKHIGTKVPKNYDQYFNPHIVK